MYTDFVVHNALEGECYGNKGLPLDKVLVMSSLKGLLLPHIIIIDTIFFNKFPLITNGQRKKKKEAGHFDF
jgi:hypothetical protein